MFNNTFLSYLTDKNILSREQALDTLETQKDTKLRIGTLAVEENLMTPEQVAALNRQQATQNMRFGELAIKAGLMTNEQLELLLSKQPRDHVILKQILTDKQYMSSEDVDSKLHEFKEALGLSHQDFEGLLDNNVDTYILKIANIIREDGSILSEYCILVISTIIRLVDKEVMVSKAAKVSLDSIPFTASLKLRNDARSMVFSAGNAATAIKFAQKFAEGFMGAVIDEDDEIARDAMKEFLNCVGGLLIAELTEAGYSDLDLDVPEFHDELPVRREAVVLPFSLLTGDELKILII